MARYKSPIALEKAMAQDVYHYSYSRKQLTDIRYTLAHAFNSRMDNLETSRSHITGETYAKAEGGAYAEAQIILKNQNRKRFSEGAVMKDYSLWDLRREITQLQGLLGMKSSTVKGFRDIENTRVQSFINKGIPEHIARNPRFYQMLKSKNFKRVSKALDSDQVIELLARDNAEVDNIDKLLEAFDEFLESNEGKEKTYKELKEIYNAKTVTPKKRNLKIKRKRG